MMDVSVVISTHQVQRVGFTADAVRSVLHQSLPPKEVIVAYDETPGLLQELQKQLPPEAILVLNDERRGLSAARITGARHATAELVAFLDDDAEATPDWLRLMVPEFENPMVAGGGGRSIPQWLDAADRPWWFPEELDWVVGCHFEDWSRGRHFVRNVIGNNMIFRRDLLLKVGGFETRVGGAIAGDDTEICLRVLQDNPRYLIFFQPEALVHHKVPKARQSVRYLMHSSWDQGSGKAVIRALYPTQQEALSSESSYLQDLALRVVPRKLAGVVRGQWQNPVHLGVIGLSVASVGWGFLTTKGRAQRMFKPRPMP